MPILVGDILKETNKAILFTSVQVKVNETAVPYASPMKGATWYPFSQITRIVRNPNLGPQEYSELHVSEWIAEKKGLYEELD